MQSEICLACGQAIKMMCQQGTRYCCENHRDKISLEGLLRTATGVSAFLPPGVGLYETRNNADAV
jgi:hypothetical protein